MRFLTAAERKSGNELRGIAGFLAEIVGTGTLADLGGEYIASAPIDQESAAV